MAGASGMPGGGASKDTEDVTRINKIPRTRYMYVTPQCRHMPIAMRIIIDQAHIHDFLTAMANSPLRIQITQITAVNMYKRVQRSAPPTDQGSGSGSPPAGGSGGSSPPAPAGAA